MRKNLYMIVTNDKYEFPLSCEEYYKKEVAEILGISEKMVIKYCCIGFPKKFKKKAVVIGNVEFDRMQYDRDHYEQRKEYFREYRRLHGQNKESINKWKKENKEHVLQYQKDYYRRKQKCVMSM